MGSAFVRLGRWRFVAAESAGGPLSVCVRHRPEMGMLKTRGYGQKYKLILNRQEGVSINLRAIRDFVWRVKVALRLGSRDFNICLVDDRQIRKLNAAYRGVSRSTDALSFPWTEAAGPPGSSPANHRQDLPRCGDSFAAPTIPSSRATSLPVSLGTSSFQLQMPGVMPAPRDTLLRKRSDGLSFTAFCTCLDTITRKTAAK